MINQSEMAWSKEYRSEYMKIYRERNKERIRIYKKDYELHRRTEESIKRARAKTDAWREKNADRYNEYQSKYREKQKMEVQV